MNKNIPIYFDSVIINSSETAQLNTEEKVHELKVRVFTKGKNRNGSYITEAVANQLIESAVANTVPVIGFFDPESKTWASHTGPTLANGYGYCKEFLGWQEFTDTDGISREYAVFSVVLFSDYFDETKYIMGANQSMELDVNSISGDWADFDGEDYYVYNTAKMLGFCIIGSHEPCFSVSAFFEKDNNREKFYNKISSLLFELSQQVEETKNLKGGGTDMGYQNLQIVDAILELDKPTSTVEEVAAENFEEQVEENTVIEETAESENEEQVELVENNAEQEVEENVVEETEVAEEPTIDYAAQNAELMAQISEYEQTIANLTATIEELRVKIGNYEVQEQARENAAKEELINSYEKLLDENEINEIRANAANFNYAEVDSQLALKYSHKKLAQKDEFNYIPVVNEQNNEFATLIAKYKKK